ncbi:hypothetical protein ACLB2K_041148 [Fragaria x ananassa]
MGALLLGSGTSPARLKSVAMSSLFSFSRHSGDFKWGGEGRSGVSGYGCGVVPPWLSHSIVADTLEGVRSYADSWLHRAEEKREKWEVKETKEISRQSERARPVPQRRGAPSPSRVTSPPPPSPPRVPSPPCSDSAGGQTTNAITPASGDSYVMAAATEDEPPPRYGLSIFVLLSLKFFALFTNLGYL